MTRIMVAEGDAGNDEGDAGSLNFLHYISYMFVV